MINDQTMALILKAIDTLKSLFTFFFIRKASQDEQRKNQFEAENKRLRKQLEIAARPKLSFAQLLERMRGGRL